MGIAVPGDPRVAEKEVEKRAKYQLLACEIHRLWQVETQIVPVVVGALGMFPNSCEDTLTPSVSPATALYLNGKRMLSLARQLSCVRSLLCNALGWVAEFFRSYFPPNSLMFAMIDI